MRRRAGGAGHRFRRARRRAAGTRLAGRGADRNRRRARGHRRTVADAARARPPHARAARRGVGRAAASAVRAGAGRRGRRSGAAHHRPPAPGRRRAVGVRAGAARTRMRRRVRVAGRARRTAAAPPRRRRARGPHLGRAVATAGSAADGVAGAAQAFARRSRTTAGSRCAWSSGAAASCRSLSSSTSPPARCACPRRAFPASFPPHGDPHARTRASLLHDGLQQRVGQPPAPRRLRQAGGRRVRRAAGELLPLARGDAQPQPHRRLVLRRRAGARVRRAAAAPRADRVSTNPKCRSPTARRSPPRSAPSTTG